MRKESSGSETVGTQQMVERQERSEQRQLCVSIGRASLAILIAMLIASLSVDVFHLLVIRNHWNFDPDLQAGYQVKKRVWGDSIVIDTLAEEVYDLPGRNMIRPVDSDRSPGAYVSIKLLFGEKIFKSVLPDHDSSYRVVSLTAHASGWPFRWTVTRTWRSVPRLNYNEYIKSVEAALAASAREESDTRILWAGVTGNVLCCVSLVVSVAYWMKLRRQRLLACCIADTT